MRNVMVDAALNDTHDGLIRLLGDTQRFGFGLEALTLRGGTGSTAVVAIILSVPIEIDAQLVAARLARHPAVRSIHVQEIEDANPADLSPMAA
jgi:hypothetical protein